MNFRNYQPIILLIINIFLIHFITSCSIFDKNLLKNSGFEESNTSTPGWSKDSYKAEDTYFVLESFGAHNGSNCISIENKTANDSRFVQKVNVTENTSYQISGWIKTENTSSVERSVNISLPKFFYAAYPKSKTNNRWEYIEFYLTVYSGIENVEIALRLGNYGALCFGKAFFDDMSMRKVTRIPKNKLYFKIGNRINKNEQTQDNLLITKSEVVKIILTIVFIILSAAYFSLLFFKKPPEDKLS